MNRTFIKLQKARGRINLSNQTSPWKWIVLISLIYMLILFALKALENTAPGIVTAPMKDRETGNRKVAALCLEYGMKALAIADTHSLACSSVS
jgi:hypothetical protein